MEARNKRLSDEEFFRERQEVLAMWPTGKEVDLDEAIEYHKSMPPTKNYALKMAEAKQNGVTLVSTMTGVPTLEGHIELLRYIQDEGHVDLLWTMIDSLTRTCQFEAAEHGLKESIRTGKNLLNGFPIVAHGVTASRKVIESVELPVLIGGNAPDWRLVTEIGLAGGHTCTSNAAMVSFWNYSKNVPLETIIRNFQYVTRLIGYYEERGVPILYWPGGGIHTLTPLSMIAAAQLIGVLLAAEQGVKNILVTGGEGNLIQGVATTITQPKLAQEYLDRFGYKDMVITCTGRGGWSGIYPLDHAQAYALTCYVALAAALSGCQRCGGKTIDEADTIPTKESNAASVRAIKMMLNLLKGQKIDILIRSSEAVRTEAEMFELETRTILDRVIALGDGDVAVGAIRAVEQGVLDMTFATTQYTTGKVLGVRDNEGAVRYLDPGNVPFTNEILEFHRHKIAERERAQGRKVDYEAVVNDLFSISRGALPNS